MLGPVGSFIGDSISLINELPAGCWLLVILILIKCYLSMLPKLILWFKILTCLIVHNIQHGGILDLVFDTSNSNTVSFLPSPFSDQFVLMIKNLMHYFIQNLTVTNLAFNPHYITHKYLCWWYLDARVSENLLWKQSPKKCKLQFLI